MAGDYIEATKRSSPAWGALADALRAGSKFAGKPFGYDNPPAQMLADLIGVNDIADTADKLSYGERLTKGRGQTLKLGDEVIGAAGALPIGKPAKLLKVAEEAGPLHKLIKGLKSAEWVPEPEVRLAAAIRDQKTLPGMTKTRPTATPVPTTPTEAGGQGMLPGLERDKQGQLAQAGADRQRLYGELGDKQAQLREKRNIRLEHRATLDRPALERIDEERVAPQEAAHADAVQRQAQLEPLAEREQGDRQLQQLAEARAGGSPDESIPDWLERTRRIAQLKDEAPIETPLGRLTRRDGGRGGYELDGDPNRYYSMPRLPAEAQPAFRERQEQLHSTRDLVRQLRDAKEAVPEVPPLPGDLERLTLNPTEHPWVAEPTNNTDRNWRYRMPADKAWWENDTGVPQSVRSFMQAAKHEPSILQYGTMPQHANSLEDFAEEFGTRAKKPIYVREETGSAYNDYDEPYKIEKEKTHGRGEPMRDQYGDYKQEEKLHDRGDYPVYDDRGDVKMVEAKGPVFDPDEPSQPLKVKYRAEGGETMREGGRYGGDTKYRYIKSEGGEPMRDERGRQKYYEKENPDYNPPDEDSLDEIRLSTDPSFRKNFIDVHDPHGEEPSMSAMSAGDSGALLYQTYLAHAANEGHQITGGNLTGDNAFRMLSNTLANAIRTGVNPRDMAGTASGVRPKAKGYAKGEEIWRALAGEADARIGRAGGNPNAVQFTGSGFTINGQPASTADIFSGIETLSPKFKDTSEGRGTKVGPKSVMQNAVYKWLENATPEEATEAAKNWGKNIGVPLASLGGAAVLAQHLRGDPPQA